MQFDETLEVQRAMAIYAHPDDAEFGMAGTVAEGANAGGEVSYCMGTNPDASTRQMLPELWQKERLEPHKPKALFLMAFGNPDTIVDVSAVVDVKIKALLAHRSQIDADSVDFIKGWMKEAGKKKRYAYAEGFKVLRFEEDGAPPRNARREGRRAPQARGRRASRSTTPSPRARRSR